MYRVITDNVQNAKKSDRAKGRKRIEENGGRGIYIHARGEGERGTEVEEGVVIEATMRYGNDGVPRAGRRASERKNRTERNDDIYAR